MVLLYGCKYTWKKLTSDRNKSSTIAISPVYVCFRSYCNLSNVRKRYSSVYMYAFIGLIKLNTLYQAQWYVSKSELQYAAPNPLFKTLCDPRANNLAHSCSRGKSMEYGQFHTECGV